MSSKETDWMHSPLCGVKLEIPAKKYREVQLKNKEWMTRVADDIEAGRALDKPARALAAAVLRSSAARLQTEQKKGRGQARQFDHGSEALVFVTMRAQGITPTVAYASIADRIGVSEAAVQKAMRIHAPGAARLLSECLGLDVPTYLFRE